MTEPQSLTIDRALIERLQPRICCSQSQATCRDDEFCSSIASEWETVENGAEKVRLQYPEESERPGIPATAEFCGAYMSWYTETGCGALAKEIADRFHSLPACPTAADVDALVKKVRRFTYRSRRNQVEEMIRRGAEEFLEPHRQQCIDRQAQIAAIEETMQRRCDIMYDASAGGGPIFNTERAEDLNTIAQFCTGVQEAEQRRFSWRTFAGGGGAVGGAWLLTKFVKMLLNAGKYISWAGTGLDTINKGTRHLFHVSLPNFARTMKYYFSFGPSRGIPPPKLITDEDVEEEAKAAEAAKKGKGVAEENGSGTPAQRRVTSEYRAATGETAIEPHPAVIRTQLANLTGSERYAEEGALFANTDDITQSYLIDLATREWYDVDLEEQVRLVAKDSRYTDGKIPIDFLLSFVRRYLNHKMMPVVEASAKVWGERGAQITGPREGVAAPEEFRPRLVEIRRQLMHDVKFSRAPSYTQDYAAKLALLHWQQLNRDEQEWLIDRRDQPDMGVLPQQYIRAFRKRAFREMETIEQLAIIVGQLERKVPTLAKMPFEIRNARARLLLRTWRRTPVEIRSALEALDDEVRAQSHHWLLSPSFLRIMEPLLAIGVRPRNALHRANEAWRYEIAPELRYRSIDLNWVMGTIVTVNEELAFYPDILEQRARKAVDGWQTLPDELRAPFLATSPSEQAADGIPQGYIALFAHAAAGIDPRSIAAEGEEGTEEGIPTDDGEDGRRGGGGAAPQGSPMGGGGANVPAPGGQASASGASHFAGFTDADPDVEILTPSERMLLDDTPDSFFGTPFAIDPVGARRVGLPGASAARTIRGAQTLAH